MRTGASRDGSLSFCRRYGLSDARCVPKIFLRSDAVRRLLQARRLPYRPDAAGRQGGDHARPLRSCARRPRRGAGDAGNARHHAAALWRQFCRLARRWRAYGETLTLGGATRDVPSGRARARLGADRGRMRRPARRRLRRLQGRRRPDLRCRSSWCPATCSSPRRPSACRCFATATPTARSPSSCVPSRCFPSAPIWSAPIRSARRSA